MAYRDESEGLRARVAELEQELTEARGTIARLTGGGEATDVTTPAEHRSAFLGAPVQQELRRDLPFEVTDAGYEAIATMLRSRLPENPQAGGIAQVGGTLTCKSGLVEIVLTRGVGMSTLKLRANHLANRFFLGLSAVMGAFFGMVPAGMAAQAAGLGKASLLFIVPALLVLTWAAVRPLLRNLTLSEHRKYQGVFESVAQIASEHRVTKRARVASPARESADVDAQAEAEAEAALGAERAPDTRRSRAV